MKFKSEEERMLNPQASTIPKPIWLDFFDNELTSLELELMQLSVKEILASPKLPVDNEDVRRLWICMAFSHPTAHADDLIKISTQILALKPSQILSYAAIGGQFDLVTRLLAKVSSALRHAMIEYDMYYAFRLSCKYGHIEIVDKLILVTPRSFIKSILGLKSRGVQNMIAADNFYSFRSACANGHTQIINKLFEAVSLENKQAMVAANNCEALSWACANGHLDVAKVLLDEVGDEDRQAMIAASNYAAFCWACYMGQLDEANMLLDTVNPDKIQTMIAAEQYFAFRSACGRGHLDLANRLLEVVSSKRTQEMIAVHSYCAFRDSCEKGQLALVKRIIDIVNPEHKREMIESDYYYPFRSACMKGHLEIANILLTMGEPEKMIEADNYYAFRMACQNNQVELVNMLMSHCACLAYTEIYNAEYSEQYVHPFIAEKLKQLLESFKAHRKEHPDTAFSLTNAEEAKFYFYIIRHIIRRNDRHLDNNLHFLLDIPGVRELAHTAVTSFYPNELVRLAKMTNNQSAARILLNIKAVKELAEEDNFYSNEVASNRLDLRALVTESS